MPDVEKTVHEDAMRLLEQHWRTNCSESEPHAYDVLSIPSEGATDDR